MKQRISAIAILAVLATAGCKEAPNPSAAPTDASSEAASPPPPVETADEKSEKQLVGVWGTNGASCASSYGANFKANGDYSDGTYEGTWAVVDGVIKYTFTYEYDPYDDAGGKQKLSPAQPFTNRIVSLGENEFTVRRPDGATIVWKRCGEGSSNYRSVESIDGPLRDEDRNLIKEWRELNGRCRGGSGDNPKTWEACDLREAYAPKMSARNLCYGKEGQSGYQYEWHRCGKGSHH